jgi:hypothetical protein
LSTEVTSAQPPKRKTLEEEALELPERDAVKLTLETIEEANRWLTGIQVIYISERN